MSKPRADRPPTPSKDAGRHRYPLSERLPELLYRTAEVAPPGVVVDLGAADGGSIWGLERAGLLGERGYAVDISEERVAFCATLSPRFEGIVADACDVRALPDGCADGVVASQLIEHVEDDLRLAPEIARLLKPGGWFYVSSVLKGPRSWWIYRREGRWVIDPTHVREYESHEQFVAAIFHPELEIAQSRTAKMRFPSSTSASARSPSPACYRPSGFRSSCSARRGSQSDCAACACRSRATTGSKPREGSACSRVSAPYGSAAIMTPVICVPGSGL